MGFPTPCGSSMANLEELAALPYRSSGAWLQQMPQERQMQLLQQLPVRSVKTHRGSGQVTPSDNPSDQVVVFGLEDKASPFGMAYVQGRRAVKLPGSFFWHIGDEIAVVFRKKVLGKISAPKIHGNLCGVGFCWFYQIFGTGFCWQFGTWHSTCTVFSARTLQIDGRPIQGSELRSSYAIFEQEDC